MESDTMTGYAIKHSGQAFTPDGKAPIDNVDAHNREQENLELEWLKTHPEHVFLYVKMPPTSPNCACEPNQATELQRPAVTLWTGLTVGSQVWIGPRCAIHGFGYGGYKRAISTRIFGALYHGWYYESSGDYCRLKRAKRQG